MQTVVVRGEPINVVECKRCGTKFFPAEQLEQHMVDHQIADHYFAKSKKWLGKQLNRTAGKKLG